MAALLVGAALVSLPAAFLALVNVCYRSLHSVLLPAPLILLALLPLSASIPATYSRRVLGWTVLFFLAAFLLVLPIFHLLDGGLEWGSRYMLIAIVLLNVLAIVAIADVRSDPLSPAVLRRAVELLATGWCCSVCCPASAGSKN